MTVDRGTRPARRAVPSSRPPRVDLAQDADGGEESVTRPVPEATVARLAVYLRVLTSLLADGRGTVSSEELAAAAGVNSAKLRKDLSLIGSSGVRGVGYDVSRLTPRSRRRSGWTARAVALVGVGNLGHALAGYGGFAQRGFPVAALFDVDPALVGTVIDGVEVQHADAIDAVCAARGVTIGVVATPAEAAQRVCDHLGPRACAASSTSRPRCSRCRPGSRCARSTWRWRCRSCRSTWRAGTARCPRPVPPPRRDRPRERCSPDEPAPGRRLAPHRRGAGARARRRLPRGHPQGPRRAPHRRARHRGDAGLHLQPRGDLRGGRDLPRRPHRGLERAGPPRARRGLRPHRPPLRALRPARRWSTCSRWPRASTRWSWARRRSSASSAPRTPTPASSARRAGCCTSWPSRRCGSASAPTPRPGSTPRAPRWSPRPSPTPRPPWAGWPGAARSWSAPGRWAP